MSYECDYVFGAGGGLGSSISRALMDDGMSKKIILSYRNGTFPGGGIQSKKIQLIANDFENPSWEKPSDHLFKEKSRAFIAHGVFHSSGIENFNLKDANRVFQINLFATLLLLKTFIENSQPGSTAVVVTSIAANDPGPNELIYGASKAALRASIKSMQKIAVSKGVRIMDIAVGAMKTNMTRDRDGWEKFIQPDEIAKYLIQVSSSAESLRFTNVEILRQKY